MTKMKAPKQVADPATFSVFGLGVSWVLATVGVVLMIALAVGVVLYTPIMGSANIDAREQYTLLPEKPSQVVLLEDGVVLEVLEPAATPTEETAEEADALDVVVEAVAVALEKAHGSQFQYEEDVCTIFVRDLRVEAVIIADSRSCVLREVPMLSFDLMCGADGQCSKLEL